MVERRWLGSANLQPIEILVAMQPLVMTNPPRRVHPRVADTNIILNELGQAMRRTKEIALLTAIRSGGLRVIVAPTLAGEIAEHLPARAVRGRFDLGSAQELWREHFAPHLRVVEGGEPDLREMPTLEHEDENDRLTGALSAILGPGSTWSADPDLTDPGLAEPYVLEIVIAIREVCALDVKLVTTAKGATLITGLGAELVRAISRMDARARVATGVLALAGIAAAMLFLRKNPGARAQMIEVLKRTTAEVMRELAAGHALQEAWSGRVPARLSLDTPRLERAIARVLAGAPAPLTADEIGHVLRAGAVVADTPSIRKELRSYSMFRRNGRSQWQLGERLDPKALF